jgi:hypothetical protein
MWLIWFIPLVIFSFLWHLNDFLNGAKKQQASVILLLLVLGSCVVASVVSGWWAGIVAAITFFLFGALLFRPFALRAARKLTPFPDIGVAEWNSRRLDSALQAISGDWQIWHKEAERWKMDKMDDEKHKGLVVDRAMAEPEIQQILSDKGAKRRDLEAMYNRSEMRQIPPKLREAAFQNPNIVKFFLSSTTDAEHTQNFGYQRAFYGPDGHLVFSLWLQYGPDQPRPPSV